MGQLIEFLPRKSDNERPEQSSERKSRSDRASAQVLFFTGVRYERQGPTGPATPSQRLAALAMTTRTN